MAVADIFPILQATLDVNGYTAVAMANGAYKIVSKDSIKSAAAVSGGNDDAFRTEVITIHYVDYQTVQRMLALGENDISVHLVVMGLDGKPIDDAVFIDGVSLNFMD